ncbi:MAG: hypothetical protein A3F41_02870 [Coxiella sp. RIFCSPHIGHO2_12_FULL_44_14]|nr:MAG: hypothetical protein A3F41_02870 [Coxiella sp. RIFCSPHIGHO2_12_FULL_44_14]
MILKILGASLGYPGLAQDVTDQVRALCNNNLLQLDANLLSPNAIRGTFGISHGSQNWRDVALVVIYQYDDEKVKIGILTRENYLHIQYAASDKAILPDTTNQLVILGAAYGKEDVTQLTQQLCKNNELHIAASASVYKDNWVGVEKSTLIVYQYGNDEPKRIIATTEGTAIHIDDFPIILEKIRHNTLDLLHFSEISAAHLDEALVALQNNTSVTTLNLSGLCRSGEQLINVEFDQLIKILAVNQTLTTINLSHTGLTNEHMARLLGVLQQNKAITHLDVSGNDLNPNLLRELTTRMRYRNFDIASPNQQPIFPDPIADASITIPADFLCPIGHVIMVDPVDVVDIDNNRHTYEREAIEAWFAEGRNTDPLTRKEVQNKTLEPNAFARRAISDFLDHHPPLKGSDEVYLPRAKFVALVDAIISENVNEVRRLIREDRRLLSRQLITMRTAFHIACECGSLEIIEFIVSQLTPQECEAILALKPVDWQPEQLNVALMHAAKNGDADRVARYLHLGADIHFRDSVGKIALSWAVQSGDLKSTTLLLDAGSNPMLESAQGNNALDYAVLAGHHKIVCLLLERNFPISEASPGKHFQYRTLQMFYAQNVMLQKDIVVLQQRQVQSEQQIDALTKQVQLLEQQERLRTDHISGTSPRPVPPPRPLRTFS